MKIPFVKLHGAKNDFILSPVSAAPEHGLPELAVAICNRYTGIGADGWMLVDRTPGEGFDASIRLFNSDGSEAELSGNGTRCAAYLLIKESPHAREVRIRTESGIKHLRLLAKHGLEFEFEMDMGDVKIVTLATVVQAKDAVLVDPGNPQCVFPVAHFGLRLEGCWGSDRARCEISKTHERVVCEKGKRPFDRSSILGARGGRDEQFRNGIDRGGGGGGGSRFSCVAGNGYHAGGVFNTTTGRVNLPDWAR